MSFGYVGDTSTSIKQQFKNAGVLSVTDVLDLESKGQLSGSLELIEEQTVSSVSTINFTNLTGYNVHYLSVNGLFSSETNQFYIRLSNDNGSSYIDSGYHYAFHRLTSADSLADTKSTSATQINTGLITSTGTARGNGYFYFYNLLNSSRYSSVNFHTVSTDGSDFRYTIGNGTLPTGETHNALQIIASAGTTSGNLKLYGVKQI